MTHVLLSFVKFKYSTSIPLISVCLNPSFYPMMKVVECIKLLAAGLLLYMWMQLLQARIAS